MSEKVSAFAVFRTKSSGKRRSHGKKRRVSGSSKSTEESESRQVLKRVEEHQATPYQLMDLTRSPKVYLPSSSSDSPSSFSSCLLPRDAVPKNQQKQNLKNVPHVCCAEKRQQNGHSPAKAKMRKTVREESLNGVHQDSKLKMVPLIESPLKNRYMFDSRLEGEKCFEWLINPTKPEVFFSELWEKRPLFIKRHNPNYYKGLFCMSTLDNILKSKNVWFGKNIDLTTYVNGKRETKNPPGRAYPSIVWDAYLNGCSVRMLNPQTFCTNVWKLNSVLQEYFNCFVGANIYLTPPGSQGFAPHYDDIEAFVLQLDGSKRWRLYAPRSPNETLPIYSSENFDEKDIGQPILDVVLNTGDLLYFPRGTIHQAVSPPDTHSLHITVSTCQKSTWGNYLQMLVPRALELAMEEDVEFRQSVPRNFLSHLGVSNSDLETEERANFLDIIGNFMTKLIRYAPVDAAADQMAKKNIHDFLPPTLTKYEASHSVHSFGEQWQEDKVPEAFEMDPDHKIKILRAGILRLVMEEDCVRIYYYLENSREYHKESEQFIEISPKLAPAVEYLCHSYPKWVVIENLPLENLEDKIEIATTLFERGLILVKNMNLNE